MKINKTQNGTELTLALDGRLDTTTAPQLEAELGGLDGITKLIFDIAKLVYISSAGLRVLLKAQKAITKNDGSMTVKNVSQEIREIFEVTGFDEILNLEA